MLILQERKDLSSIRKGLGAIFLIPVSSMSSPRPSI